MIRRVRELEIRYTPRRLTLPFPGRVSSPAEAARLAAVLVGGAPVEKVVGLHFTTRRTLIGLHIVSIGTLDEALVHPRSVFQAALLTNAASLIVAHNHPSGDPTPSTQDRALGDRLRQAGDLLGVTLDDFLIVTDGPGYFSERESGRWS